MPVAKKKPVGNLEEVEPEPVAETEPEPVEEEEILSEDEEIEIKKPVKRAVKQGVYKNYGEPRKEKKERTQAQKDSWARCLAARKEKRDERLKIKEEDAKQLETYKKQLVKKNTEKVLRKAVAIKKKAAVMDKVLDEISDDETPIEVVKEKIKQRRAQAKPKPEPDTRYQYMTEPEMYVPTIRFI
jgi:lysyl-tRNA synthetase class I